MRLRHHRAAFDRAARRRHAHAIAVGDALLARQLLGHLDEELRLQLHAVRVVLRPVVEVLGQPVGRADDRVLVGRAEHVELGRERLARPDSSSAPDAAGSPPAIRPARSAPTTGPSTNWPGTNRRATPSGSMMNAPSPACGALSARDVGHVAGPALAVPRDAGTRRIPRPALRVGRAAVVEDAAIGRPAERPLRIAAQPARIGGRSPLREVAGIGVHADVEPVARERRAVGLRVERTRVELSAVGRSPSR